MQGEPVAAEPSRRETGPSEDAIRQALELATSQVPLSRSKRLSGFLRYIVDESLAGRAELISGYSIAVDVFGKPESFDPTIDSIVRVEAGRLRQRLAEYYRELGADDPIEIALPKGSYIPEFKPRAKRQAGTPSPAGTTRHGPSIAVLPFQNYGAEASDQFFADGLTEEIIANLARFKELFVFSRTTTTKLMSEGAHVLALHEALGADFALEGSVRKSSEAVRVTVQLVDAATGGQIFSERFHRPCTPEGIFEIQDDIARLVAGRVADRYGPLGRYVARASRSGKPQRWETYLWIVRFYDYYARHDVELHREVRDGLEHALKSDPESSDACAALAAIHVDEHRLGLNPRPESPALDRALETALRAVTYDPDNAMAYQFLAVTYYHRFELDDFDIAAQRAIELNPGHADVLADVGFCYAYAGQWDRGLALLDRAIEISPVHPGWFRMPRAIRNLLDDDPGAAILELKKSPMPGFFWCHALMACFHASAGSDDEAAAEVEALLTAFPDFAAQAASQTRIWTANEEILDKLAEGWRKAGLAVD
ncbi:MAG: hypothetical protein MI920_18640 [Kiloniellales bacterium]|nr:hypothetical protein [Kiloniellales bacterium]